MTDDQTVDAPAADTDTTPQAGTDNAPEANVDDETLTVQAARKLRSEHQNLRERLKQAEQKLSEREKAELTEKQQLERDAQDSKERLTSAESENRFLRAQVAAYQLGVREKFLEHIPKLLDWNEIDDPADTKQVTKAIREFLKENPEMVKTGNAADAGAGNSRRADGGLDMNQWIREHARR
jgi:TolA-binding protein